MGEGVAAALGWGAIPTVREALMDGGAPEMCADAANHGERGEASLMRGGGGEAGGRGCKERGRREPGAPATSTRVCQAPTQHAHSHTDILNSPEFLQPHLLQRSHYGNSDWQLRQ